MTLYSFYRKLSWTLIERGKVVPEYFRIRMAWDSFCQLLPTKKYFLCPEFGSCPKLIIADGLTLAFKKRYRLPDSEQEKEGPNILDGCKYVQFSYFVRLFYAKQSNFINFSTKF